MVDSNNMQKCNKCSSLNPSGYVYCMNCGARKDGKFNCAKCGALLNQDTVFCTYCGKRQDGKKECPKCSVVLEETANFCWKCGHSFKEDIPIKEKNKHFFKQENSSNQDKQNYFYTLFKLSFVAVITLTMLILCFLPIQTITTNTDLNINSTSYIALMFDQIKEYDTQDEFLDSSLGKRFNKYTEKIVANPSKAAQLTKKHSPTFVRGMLILRRIQNDNTDHSMKVDLSIKGILSFLYILSTAAIFVLSLLKLIFFILKKEVDLNRYNFLYALALLFVIPLALLANKFSYTATTIHGCLIAYLVIFSVLLLSKAIFHILENRIQNIRRFVIKAVTLCLVAVSLGCMSLSIFKTEIIYKVSDSQKKTYEYEYDSYSAIYAFNNLDSENREAITSQYEDLKDYVGQLETNMSHGYFMLPQYNDFDQIPSQIFVLIDIFLLDFLLNIHFIAYLIMIVSSSLLLYFLYRNLFDNQKCNSAIKASILFFTFSFISLMLSIITVIILDLALESIYNLVFKISAGCIVVAVLSIVNMIMTKVCFKNYKQEKE